MKPTGDKIFDYNAKVFDAIFGPIKLAAGEATCGIYEDTELSRDNEIEAREEQRREDDERILDAGAEFENACGAAP